MKKCPACETVYNDNTICFCAKCGAELVDDVVAEPVTEPVTEPITEPVAEPAPQPTPPPAPSQYNYNYNNQYNTPPCKYCSHCGNPCDPKAAICVKCGAPFGNTYSKYPREDDKPSGGLKFLCFFIPILGLILYLVNMNDKPVSAKAYGKSALIGFIVSIVLYILYFVFLLFIPLFAFTFDPGVTYYDSDILYSGICNLL